MRSQTRPCLLSQVWAASPRWPLSNHRSPQWNNYRKQQQPTQCWKELKAQELHLRGNQVPSRTSDSSRLQRQQKTANLRLSSSQNTQRCFLSSSNRFTPMWSRKWRQKQPCSHHMWACRARTSSCLSYRRNSQSANSPFTVKKNLRKFSRFKKKHCQLGTIWWCLQSVTRRATSQGAWWIYRPRWISQAK